MYEDKMSSYILVDCIGRWTAVRLHHLVEDVIQQHRCIPTNGGGSGGWGNLEGIVDVSVECVVHCAICCTLCCSSSSGE